ncbi:hypothetical protein GCM10025857_33450 [Alicyclobacillus contaminans]|nr:hypothetical protein GCM10025857_33450 [Alicyclobacillus contaminans]
MTGAPVPEGADAVVRFEWCDASDGKHVTVRRPVAPGESIQPRGEDCEVGSHLLPAGTLLRHAEVALLCAAGVAEVDVFTTPKVAVVVTGSELVPQPSTPLGKGQIYACNDLLVAAMVESCGAVVAAVEYVADQLESVQAAIRRAAETADCVITTGGASVGDFDCVPQALRQLGATVHMEKVWMRPGTPFVAASLGNTPVFGLSGNPAACSIQAEVLVRAFFDGCCGRAPNPFPWTGILKDDIVLSPVKHTRVLRARALSANGQLLVDASLAQSPGVLRSLVSANCLIRVPGGGAERGSEVPLRWLW